MARNKRRELPAKSQQMRRTYQGRIENKRLPNYKRYLFTRNMHIYLMGLLLIIGLWAFQQFKPKPSKAWYTPPNYEWKIKEAVVSENGLIWITEIEEDKL